MNEKTSDASGDGGTRVTTPQTGTDRRPQPALFGRTKWKRRGHFSAPAPVFFSSTTIPHVAFHGNTSIRPAVPATTLTQRCAITRTGKKKKKKDVEGVWDKIAANPQRSSLRVVFFVVRLERHVSPSVCMQRDKDLSVGWLAGWVGLVL